MQVLIRKKKDKLYPGYLEFIETCRLEKLPKAHAPGQTLVFSATTWVILQKSCLSILKLDLYRM
jgi:hypothetical protein